MSNLKSHTEPIEIKSISDLEQGDKIINLGKVLEIEESAEFYAIIILRMNQKQVFKFEKNTSLYLSKEVEPG
ncbi:MULTISPECIES: hypothetical protein [Pedobacter]|uniref:Uncharacterized protein n=1 Tax=Pedobacter heparinus (strain ATCC 13125 / DSM 2366 / CIP 104194 / JCM 7457 / NBRC 12017 / NCIMB 9290 / NRRL B-14731 / HIM 762-3) TaxID=485917 RepID=C6XYU5_PEDHD|nr:MULTISPECIES: hypothetical protein [Pedobacter]ACU04577.1 hypothetical protein Phep_2373 [Pedobacter heparinus DSM 2366]MBB5437573.1 hypothetical protein [Pedobacter sp. AK017]